MESILRSWGSTFRFIVIALLLIFIIFLMISRVADSTKFDINYSNDKTLVTIIDKKQVAATSVLPACDCWINTGIEFRPGESYEIKVSGKIHASVEKLMEAAQNDSIPKHAWIGPEGSEFINYNKESVPSDKIRKNLLINPKANLGAVLLYFQKENSKKPNCTTGNDMFIPDSTVIYTKEGYKGINDTKVKMYLWASVNDMIIRDMSADSSRIAYLGTRKGMELKKKEANWKVIQQNQYNRLWYDDNFGQFVISAKIDKPIPFWGIW